MLQDAIEDTENADPVMHEPLLAEEEPLPTPPESPLLNELDRLMPGSSPARTPSPSLAITSKEDPKLLSPRSITEDKSVKQGSIKPNSAPASRPTTPATAAPPPALAAPEGEGAPSSRGPSRSPSRHSNKNEQGSELEIKPLQKFDSEAKAPDLPPAPAAPIANSLSLPDEVEVEEEEAPPPQPSKPSKAATPEPKAPEPKPERAPSVQERPPSTLEKKAPSREGSRPSSKAETRPLPKRQPSPAPTPKPPLNVEPKTITKQVEAKVIAAKSTLKPVVSNSSLEGVAEASDMEVRLSKCPFVDSQALIFDSKDFVFMEVLHCSLKM